MTSPSAPPMSLLVARGLVFGSSAAVLVLEILAGRLMAPFVGVSLETFTGIIGVILAGIATGTAVGGRIADRIDPTPLIGPTLMAGGALAWWALWIVQVLGPSAGRGPVAIIVLTALGFLAPATVLSAVSPMVAKLRLRSLDETGTVVGSLSAWGTWGALFGVFITGFVLVAALPVSVIVIVTGAVLVVAGALFSWSVRGDGPRSLPVASTVMVLVSFGVGVSAPSPCDFASTYYCGQIVTDPDDPSIKSLVLDDLVHARVDLDDPADLQLRYVRLLGAAADAIDDGPIDVLHIGGGGFTLPRYIDATRPGSSHFIAEIDGVLADVVDTELGFDASLTTTVHIGDARLAIADAADDSFDLIVGDAFASKSVPWHITTSEFAAELDRVLRADGVYAMNIIDGGENQLVEWTLATLHQHFDHLAIIEPSDGVGDFLVNQIIIASDAPIERFEIDPDDGRWVDDVDEWRQQGRVLTDDYAPVDQLIG